jgi:dihydrofolate reductase
MRSISVFNLVTVDGFFAGSNGDISWHNVDDEFQEMAIKVSNSGHLLLFGRVTYELMAGFWPTAEALKNDPIVAAGMNKSTKIVFSRTLAKADWNNTRLVNGDMVSEVRKLKQEPGPEMAVLGSGTIVSQLTQEGLIDEYNFMVNPVALGSGKTMFEGLKEKVMLKLINSRVFKNGNVLLTYESHHK